LADAGQPIHIMPAGDDGCGLLADDAGGKHRRLVSASA
jgi:hypothetical protein